MTDHLKKHVASWFCRWLTPCQEAMSIVNESLDRMLTLRERMKLKLHLKLCELCSQNSELRKAMLRLLYTRREMNHDAAEQASLSSETRERIKRLLSQHNRGQRRSDSVRD